MASPVKAAVQDIRRLRGIASVLTRHGFSAVATRAGLGRFVSERDDSDAFDDDDLLGEDRSETAVRFRRVLEDLGPTFVKLGQILSTRPDIIPSEFIEELKVLQDRVAPMPYEDIEAQIEAGLDRKLADCFATFEEKPLAAASIGQVHRATTHEGKEVVVKVQRLGIREQIQSDLDLLYYLAKFLEATVQEFELYTPTAVIREFETAILSELDFRSEANNVLEFGKNFADVEAISVPEIYKELSSAEILTMEFVDARKLSQIEGGSEEAEVVLKTLLDSMVKMVLYDGFFHGDPHPGNILVREDSSLVFIDFGLVGRLSVAQQDELISLVLNVIAGDVDAISRTILRMGHPVGRVNLRAFRADVERIRDQFLLASLHDINVSRFVQEVMDAAQSHRIRLNPNYAVLTKSAMTIEGIMRTLQPDLDIMAIGMPYARELAMRRFSAKKIMQSAINTAMGFSSFVTQVPQQLDQVLMDLESGNLTITIKNEALEQVGNQLNTLGTRLFLGVIASGLAVTAALLLRSHDVAIFGVSLMLMFGILAGVSASLLFWWALTWHIVGSGKNRKLRLAPLMRLFRRS